MMPSSSLYKKRIKLIFVVNTSELNHISIREYIKLGEVSYLIVNLL